VAIFNQTWSPPFRQRVTGPVPAIGTHPP